LRPLGTVFPNDSDLRHGVEDGEMAGVVERLSCLIAEDAAEVDPDEGTVF
jgi:hypothetical protein